jgi:hypothetical protein
VGNRRSPCSGQSIKWPPSSPQTVLSLSPASMNTLFLDIFSYASVKVSFRQATKSKPSLPTGPASMPFALLRPFLLRLRDFCSRPSDRIQTAVSSSPRPRILLIFHSDLDDFDAV